MKAAVPGSSSKIKITCSDSWLSQLPKLVFFFLFPALEAWLLVSTRTHLQIHHLDTIVSTVFKAFCRVSHNTITSVLQGGASNFQVSDHTWLTATDEVRSLAQFRHTQSYLRGIKQQSYTGTYLGVSSMELSELYFRVHLIKIVL